MLSISLSLSCRTFMNMSLVPNQLRIRSFHVTIHHLSFSPCTSPEMYLMYIPSISVVGGSMTEWSERLLTDHKGLPSPRLGHACLPKISTVLELVNHNISESILTETLNTMDLFHVFISTLWFAFG